MLFILVQKRYTHVDTQSHRQIFHKKTRQIRIMLMGISITLSCLFYKKEPFPTCSINWIIKERKRKKDVQIGKWKIYAVSIVWLQHDEAVIYHIHIWRCCVTNPTDFESFCWESSHLSLFGRSWSQIWLLANILASLFQ